MACGGCASRRNARTDALAGDGLTTKYRVTWGDGSTDMYESSPKARMAMGAQSDPKKRKGMRVLSVRA